MESFEKISILILGSLREDIGKEDVLVLDEWTRVSRENADFFHQFSNQEVLVSKLTAFRQVDSVSMWHRTLEKIESDPADIPWKEFRRKGFFIRRWKYVAAAMILLIAGTTYFFLRPVIHRQEEISPTHQPVVNSSGIAVVPGSSRATLTLADGSVFVLDKMKNGLLAEREGMRIEKTSEGELSYVPGTTAPSGNAGYNMLSTPRGGQYKLVLPDGTRVWLNAGSSLKYPVAIGSRDHGVERSVELSGEAYFEVASLPIPFKVTIASMHGAGGDRRDGSFVEVLGTHFNIMAYEDEPVVRASLLGGSIRVNAGLAPVTLKPGQQAVFAESRANIRVIHTPGNVKAWVDGDMQLDGQTLPAIMRQLSRWYDVDVEYSGKIPSMNLVGTFSRRTAIEDIIKILNVQAGKALEFRMVGRKIRVINGNR